MCVGGGECRGGTGTGKRKRQSRGRQDMTTGERGRGTACTSPCSMHIDMPVSKHIPSRKST